MRIATWNLAGRWDERHAALVDGLRADVLLLTEVSERVTLPGWHVASTVDPMAAKRHWAAIAAREPIQDVALPHPASVAGTVHEVRWCSSILPWRGCTPRPFWVGERLIEKTIHAASVVEASAPQVWGGDWNQAFAGPETAGTKAGRVWLREALGRLGLQLPTAELPHRIEGLSSIDHIAVPASWRVVGTERIDASQAGRRLSDHDAYVVEAHPH